MKTKKLLIATLTAIMVLAIVPILSACGNGGGKTTYQDLNTPTIWLDSDQHTLKWNAVPNATSYEIWISLNYDPDYVVANGSGYKTGIAQNVTSYDLNDIKTANGNTLDSFDEYKIGFAAIGGKVGNIVYNEKHAELVLSRTAGDNALWGTDLTADGLTDEQAVTLVKTAIESLTYTVSASEQSEWSILTTGFATFIRAIWASEGIDFHDCNTSVGTVPDKFIAPTTTTNGTYFFTVTIMREMVIQETSELTLTITI